MNTNTLYSKLYEVQAIELQFAVTTEKKQFSSLHVNVKKKPKTFGIVDRRFRSTSKVIVGLSVAKLVAKKYQREVKRYIYMHVH